MSAPSSLPSTAKAVQMAKTGGVDVFEYKDVPVPSAPGPGQLLVRNRFAGVNYRDTYFRTGLYAAPVLPLILVVSAATAVAVPDGLELDKAAAVLLQGLTAWIFIREAANVQPGQWTLVHAAAGGVGLLLVQMLRIVGAKVIGTASSEEKRELARKNGAGWTLDSRSDDMVARVKEITDGHGVDVIFDGVGKATFDAGLEMIAIKGHFISFGNASGAVPPVNILQLGPKNIKLMRPGLFGYVAERKDMERYTSELFDLVTSSQLNVVIHDVYPLKDVARAHTDIESRKTSGKLLIKCD
ncbi:Alcohol dehydrogenase superfamily, zinc-type [Ophiocordyceps sinensis CO18]|uniref:Probable quinone oxidoreductase n=1 Tax=Ophiocordyceps sinensis (strain Co18 / CGMCC 3.14243) TaxID=911162 RepID=T5AA62_OPHSC|nr:Alcohol dehydrogenase superfamily, zinc-type [Ophiocordyceps sinensis CO18]